MHKFTEFRGPTDYFHGRDEIINSFLRALDHYQSSVGGSIFLIKGPPGAGKTALMSELSKHAESIGYTIVDNITPSALHDPAAMAKRLGVPCTPRRDSGGGINAKIVSLFRKKETVEQPSVVDIIRKAASSNGLLLVLDEAQHIADLASPSSVKVKTTSTLNMLHNGHVGYPVILLAGGLGTTEMAFESLGVSRIEDDLRVRLGALDAFSTRAVLEDNLRHRCGMESPPAGWILTLAKQTHGWPHHIMCYVEAVRQVITEGGEKPTQAALERVLEVGKAYQLAYYETRAHGINRDQRSLIADLFADQPIGATITQRSLMDSLMENHSREDAVEVFRRALRQGILDEHTNGDYAIPIPSMQTWLVSEYVPDKSIDAVRQPIQKHHSRKKERGGNQGLGRYTNAPGVTVSGTATE